MGNRSGQSSTPSHHRTRSRMDEVVQAAASSNAQQQANSSPSRGKKRKVITSPHEQLSHLLKLIANYPFFHTESSFFFSCRHYSRRFRIDITSRSTQQ